eukprot:7991047-Lingulodinium_polyedra.AAC.1
MAATPCCGKLALAYGTRAALPATGGLSRWANRGPRLASPPSRRARSSGTWRIGGQPGSLGMAVRRSRGRAWLLAGRR